MCSTGFVINFWTIQHLLFSRRRSSWNFISQIGLTLLMSNILMDLCCSQAVFMDLRCWYRMICNLMRTKHRHYRGLRKFTGASYFALGPSLNRFTGVSNHRENVLSHRFCFLLFQDTTSPEWQSVDWGKFGWTYREKLEDNTVFPPWKLPASVEWAHSLPRVLLNSGGKRKETFKNILTL